MDDGIKSTTKQAKGSIKEAIGMLIGDPAVEAEGAAEKAAGAAHHEADARKGKATKPDTAPQ